MTVISRPKPLPTTTPHQGASGVVPLRDMITNTTSTVPPNSSISQKPLYAPPPFALKMTNTYLPPPPSPLPVVPAPSGKVYQETLYAPRPSAPNKTNTYLQPPPSPSPSPQIVGKIPAEAQPPQPPPILVIAPPPPAKNGVGEGRPKVPFPIPPIIIDPKPNNDIPPVKLVQELTSPIALNLSQAGKRFVCLFKRGQ